MRLHGLLYRVWGQDPDSPSCGPGTENSSDVEGARMQGVRIHGACVRTQNSARCAEQTCVKTNRTRNLKTRHQNCDVKTKRVIFDDVSIPQTTIQQHPPPQMEPLVPHQRQRQCRPPVAVVQLTRPLVLILLTTLVLLSCLTTPLHAADDAAAAQTPTGGTSGDTSEVQYIVDTFSDATNNGNFNHLAVDVHTGRLYIGAVNRLYQLSENLSQEKAITTGPKDDSPNCPPEGQECICRTNNCEDFIRKPTNSISKALVIDESAGRLITCTNLYQGHCEKRYLSDISQMDDHVFKSIVPNDETSPAIVFIGPGVTKEESGADQSEERLVLYVAATRSTQGLELYKDLVPNLSSRDLDTFALAAKDISRGTKLDLEYRQRQTFRVNYVDGFISGGFSYVVAIQPDKLELQSSDYVSKIIRVCQKDRKFYSFAEMDLQCNHEGRLYNILRAIDVAHPGAHLARSLGLSHLPPPSDTEDVLFALFARSDAKSMEPLADSVMCVFPLKEIRRTFTENIQDCFRGVGNTGPAHISVPDVCINTDFAIEDDYCGAYELNNPIAGTKPISANAVIRFDGVLASSVAVTDTHEYTVAFVGTADGNIKKVVIESETTAHEYDTVSIDPGSAIARDMDFDRSQAHVYVMSEKKVTMVKVQQCDRFQTCGECLGAGDPYCGWCVLESKCSLKSECTNHEDTLRWLPYKDSQCTNITRVIPEQVQRKPNGATDLMLHVKNLPSITSGGYFCAFSGYGVVRITSAEIRGASSSSPGETQVHCKTPEDNTLPPIPTRKDHIVMDLSVRMNNKDFVSRNFTFFDCSLHNACTSCTESDFPCTWCVENHQCTDNQENCLTDTLITGRNVKGISDRPGPQTCPRIEASFTEILVPSGQDKKVRVKALNLEDFQTDFKCNFNIDGGRLVNAVKLVGSDVIECDSITFQYSGSSPHRNVPFQITWGASDPKPFDNPDIIQVKVYKCMSMADDCGGCLTLEPKYNCGWCDSQCTIEQHCTGKTWLDNSQDCPNPVITSFHPTTGPRQGGTRLTIYGNNLGKVFDDVNDGVTVANIPCVAIEDEYEPAKKVVCTTGDSDTLKTGPVFIRIKNKFSDASDVLFSYVEPRITDFSPKKGPISGGTRITIRGDDMDAGTTVTASVVGLPCNVTSTSERSAVCITSPNVIASEGLVEMRFDKATVQYDSDTFSYVEDPHIFGIEPDRSILSGGMLITVNGANLNSVQEPRMYVHLNGRPYNSNCSVASDTVMYCDSPSMGSSGLQSSIDPENPLTTSFGFIMDNVTDLKNLTALSNGEKKLTLFPDPHLEPFEDGVLYFQSKNDYLTIDGKNLNLALNKEDYRVMVGLKECNVQWVDTNKLTCKPPPSSVDGVGNNPKVSVMAGRNLTFAIGTLKYESALGLPLPIIIAIGAGGGILILIIIIIFIAYKRKSRESDRVMKRMQNQMDTLEAKVAKECKEAFAELQTDMTEITSDLGGNAGIPFRDYRSFTMRVLFPNVPEDDHPVTRPMEVDLTRRDGFDRGLKLFHNLLLNKTFLLLFIRTLESHRDFSMRERVNVASLISVALQNRMEYHTDILKTLLAELIEKSMEGRSHPKLLLRRTESVAEKMLTNWFTFLLFKFLKECAGEPLFMLYRAIKGQVDKGPVDYLTSEAKYSLSEDKLIRQQLDYKTMTIYVIDPDIQFGSQEHAVKVLDCDSVSQVKEKILDAIYKNAPYSSRPIRDDLDLEWRTGVKGRLILQDEDMTTKSEGDYRRLNTLAHYKVPDGSVMALIPRQASMNLVPKQSSLYNLSLGSDKSGSHHRFDMYAMSGSPSLTRSLSPNNIHIDIDTGSKYYHLVKPHEESKGEDRGNKMVSEIYLTRLLATKGTLQQYVDDLFETIFSTTNRGCALPLAIKYMFDFLDDQALHHGINDPEVVHTWKSNSLPLRFWINVVKNPDFVFDVHKSNIVDACLSVTAQTFMDSCSMSEHRLGKDSPSSKLLYAKDIPKYKKWVERYYQDVKLMPAISDQDMNSTLAEESRSHSHEFNINAALYELYHYVIRYNDELLATLEEDEFARNYRLAFKMEQVQINMDCAEC